MKILITNTGPWGTGSFTVARALMEEFVELGHEVKIFFPDSGLPSEELDYFYSNKELFEIWKFPIKNEKAKLESFPLIIPDPHPRNNVGKTFLELNSHELNLYLSDFKVKISKLIDEFKPDVIECQHIWAFDHIIDELGYPFACVAHHSDQLGFRYDERMQEIAINSAQNARYIFSISDSVTEEVLELYNVPKEKVITTFNGYNRRIFYPKEISREEVLKHFDLDIPKEAKIVTFAGKLSKTKGIDTLLMANRLIDANENLHLIILGAGKLESVLDPSNPELYNFERVHFIGHQSPKHLANIHNIAHLSVMPSRSEGFGISCLEAMACGLPMVVTRSGGPEDYAVGEIIDPEDHHALASAIVKIANLPQDHYAKLSQQAAEAAHHFSWLSIAKQRLSYYEEMSA